MEVISGISVKSDSKTHIFETSSEKSFKMQTGVIAVSFITLLVNRYILIPATGEVYISYTRQTMMLCLQLGNSQKFIESQLRLQL